MSLLKSLVKLVPQASRSQVHKWALQKYAEYRIRKSIIKETFDRFDDRHYWIARRMRSDEETPHHQRMRWVSHQTPQSFKMDLFEAQAEEYEDLLEYKNPFADSPGGAGAVSRASGSRGMHVSEAVQVLQLTDSTENHINERYNFLLAANTFKGSSAYIADKLDEAKLVALKYCRDGRLKEHIKKKPEAAAPEEEQEAEGKEEPTTAKADEAKAEEQEQPKKSDGSDSAETSGPKSS